MANIPVRITFVKDESGALEYIFPNVFHLSDPQEGIKATVIPGTRGDGSIVIPGGKRSQILTVRGNIFDSDGYKEITDDMTEMRTKVTTDVGILTLEHKEGVSWITDWTYTVRRVSEINFPQSFRTGRQEYQASFIVLAYS